MPAAELALPWWMPSPETVRERERILAGQFFLVKIAGNGDVWRCRRCNAKHAYLTLMCVEQPFSGLTQGLYAYWKTTQDTEADMALSPGQRARFATLSKMFGPQENLANSHPQTARAWSTGERDMDYGAISLGLMEPITRAMARQLVGRINGAGLRPPLVLPGLEV